MKIAGLGLHFYEVIREGAASKLYFDVEFNPILNPDKDGDKHPQPINRVRREVNKIQNDS